MKAKTNMTTTIKLHQETKAELDSLREHMSETYDEIIQKVIYIVRKADDEPELSKKTLKAIEAARERMAKGEYYTWAEAKKRLGL